MADIEEAQRPKECLEDFRRKWFPGLDLIWSSAVDVASDLYYLYTILSLDEDIIAVYVYPLIGVTAISVVLFLLVFFNHCVKAGDPTRDVCCVDPVRRMICPCVGTGTFLSLAEDVLEDIPTIYLTFMIDRHMNGLTQAGILSIALSIFNLVLNAIKMLTPKETVANLRRPLMENT
eukprot:CAMPEP_0194326602 /NCGR_PEP_ID=MMETSP0171-20130528/37335_1 /TAXON_ID=218684 /ORGANISM="Corethron pennatum, Strain L29A3" /LENGTH=175 /DNA_ID=CAMNT_0039086259 /DNA_START=46 /DNA_END=573 /DNA_ORIENTATION=+